MSRVEVDKIQQQCGTTLTVGGGACKTAVVDATTVTLGRCGGTVSLASGATQSGFGRTGTVDWQTGSIKTTTFTAANGAGYFADTSGGAFTMNLPAGSAGDIVSVVDYTNTFQTYALTVTPNGSEKIGGVAASVSLKTEGQSVTFVYVDGTEGWKNVQDSTSNVVGASFITATGGTPSQSGDYEIRTFTGPGTFCISALSNNPANNVVDYLVVAGGGGGGQANPMPWSAAGGGGGGGYRESVPSPAAWTGSPLANPGNARPVSVAPYTITVDGGGAVNTPGGVSTFSDITSAGVEEVDMVHLHLIFQEVPEVQEEEELIIIRHHLFQLVEEQVMILQQFRLKEPMEEMVIRQMELVPVVEVQFQSQEIFLVQPHR